MERVKENIDKKSVMQSTQSPTQSIAIPLPAGNNLKIGINAITNKPTNSSCSEHKISGRSGSAIASSTLNNHILLSIN